MITSQNGVDYSISYEMVKNIKKKHNNKKHEAKNGFLTAPVRGHATPEIFWNLDSGEGCLPYIQWCKVTKYFYLSSFIQ